MNRRNFAKTVGIGACVLSAPKVLSWQSKPFGTHVGETYFVDGHKVTDFTFVLDKNVFPSFYTTEEKNYTTYVPIYHECFDDEQRWRSNLAKIVKHQRYKNPESVELSNVEVRNRDYPDVVGRLFTFAVPELTGDSVIDDGHYVWTAQEWWSHIHKRCIEQDLKWNKTYFDNI